MEDQNDTKFIKGFEHVRYYLDSYESEEIVAKSKSFYDWINKRRSVRDFSDKPIPKEVIDNILLAASSAPSGAHKQPWVFCAVTNSSIKSKIRKAAEKEEFDSYHGRMNDEWIEALRSIGTDWHKSFLETAPYLIAIFKKPYEIDENGEKTNNYYINESVGIATGFLLTAIYNAGLVALTHTPSPMNFLNKILNRPPNERPYLLIPIGYPAEKVYVPKLTRKSISEISVFYE